MPIYEYECGSCRHRFEKRQGFEDEAKAACPKCKGKSKRIIRASPVIFKGSGFYVTDYRKEKDPEKVTNPASAPSKPSEAAAKKPEAAATKSETTAKPSTPAPKAQASPAK